MVSTVSPLHMNLHVLNFLRCEHGAYRWSTVGNGVPEKEPTESRESRSNWRTKETHDAGNSKGIFLIWEALLIFEAKHPNIDWHTKVAAAIQNAIQCYRVICDEKASLIAQWVKNPPAMQEDPNLIPGLERSAGEGKGYPLQYSTLENSTDCIVHGVAKCWTQLSDFHFHDEKKELLPRHHWIIFSSG